MLSRPNRGPASERVCIASRTCPAVRPGLNGRSTARWGAGRVILLLLLIVVCANVGALIYARNASRVSEVTIRQALGASRTRILAQLLVESLLLAVLGAAAGLVLARWGIAAVARIVMVVQSGGTVTLPYWWQWNLRRMSCGMWLA